MTIADQAHIAQSPTDETGLSRIRSIRATRPAEKLQGALGEGDPGADFLPIRVQVGRILEAVKATVPEPMWGEIANGLDDAELVQPSREPLYPGEDEDDNDEWFHAGDVGGDDGEPFDPGDVGDDDDF